MKIEIITGADNNPVAEFFSTRSTPETDANEAWPATKLRLGNDGVVPADFARRLERERDEARKERDQLKEALLIMEALLKPGLDLFPEIGEILKRGAAK